MASSSTIDEQLQLTRCYYFTHTMLSKDCPFTQINEQRFSPGIPSWKQNLMEKVVYQEKSHLYNAFIFI